MSSGKKRKREKEAVSASISHDIGRIAIAHVEKYSDTLGDVWFPLTEALDLIDPKNYQGIKPTMTKRMGTMWSTLRINEDIKFYELKPGVAYQRGNYRKDGRRDFIRRLVAIPPQSSHGLQDSPGGSDQFTYKQVDATKPTNSPFGSIRGKEGSSKHRRVYAAMASMKAAAEREIHPTLLKCVVDVIKLKIPNKKKKKDE